MRIAVIFAAALCAAPAFAGTSPTPDISWGKAGVSFDQYRHDASLCLQVAEHADISGSEPVRALILASRRADTAADVDPLAVQQAVQFARPEERFRQVRALLQTAMNDCLTGLGYHRFRLTDAQRTHLRHLAPGHPERQHYLHSLASDPAIIAAQAAE